MTHAPEMRAIPRRILLATELGSRSDRALDRAARLAREWDARLHVVHAIAASQAPAPAARIPVDNPFEHPDSRGETLRLIRRDLDAEGLVATVHVETATPATAILAVAEREGCDLVVLGESRRSLLAPIVESTIDQVMRKSPSSVLVVRDRPRHAYRHMLVGTDFSDEAGQALVVAARLFADASITLMHAFSMPYLSLLDATPEAQALMAGQQEKLHGQIASSALPDARKATILSSVEAGPPGAILRRYVLEQGADLTVIGAHPRGMLFDAVVGNSRRILEAVPGDILMVRAMRPGLAEAAT